MGQITTSANVEIIEFYLLILDYSADQEFVSHFYILHHQVDGHTFLIK